MQAQLRSQDSNSWQDEKTAPWSEGSLVPTRSAILPRRAFRLHELTGSSLLLPWPCGVGLCTESVGCVTGACSFLLFFALCVWLSSTASCSCSCFLSLRFFFFFLLSVACGCATLAVPGHWLQAPRASQTGAAQAPLQWKTESLISRTITTRDTYLSARSGCSGIIGGCNQDRRAIQSIYLERDSLAVQGKQPEEAQACTGFTWNAEVCWRCTPTFGPNLNHLLGFYGYKTGTRTPRCTTETVPRA